MSPFPEPDFVSHGGRLTAACAAYGGEPHAWLDLSTGINPLPWPGASTGGTAIAPNWHRLPDPVSLARLESLAAAHFGVERRHCCAVPGSELALRVIALLLGLPGAHVPPCYASHTDAFATSRAVATPGELREAATTVLANPNNPDGRLRTASELAEWRAASVATDGWLILDEAFADVSASLSLAGAVSEDAEADGRLIVLRSFGKFFGLAGARLGFVLAPEALLARLRAALGEWPVSAGALALGLGAYADAAWIARTRVRLPAMAAALDAVLVRHGLEPRGGCPLFRLVDSDVAPAIFERLARAHILTRPFAEQPRWLRFGLPADATALARLDTALG